MLDIYDYIKYASDPLKFDVTCPEGMTGGKYGCNPNSQWVKNQAENPPNYYPA